jgi:hypothetical protein
MKAILDLLEKSREERAIISVYFYGNNGGFWSGYVNDYDDEFFVFQHYTKYGKPDGVVVERIANIESIEFNDDYARAITHLIHHAAELDKQDDVELEISNKENWHFDILEPFINSKDRLVQIKLNSGDNYTGFVEWVDEACLTLNLIGTTGMDQGQSIYKLEDIRRIRLDSLDHRKALLLYKWRRNEKLRNEEMKNEVHLIPQRASFHFLIS